MTAVHRSEPVFEDDSKRSAALLRVVERAKPKDTVELRVGRDRIELSAAYAELLRRVAQILATGDAATVVPVHRELTTQRAAAILNVSRQHVATLVESKKLPAHRTVGGHRRIRLSDLLEYKRARDTERDASFDKLVALSAKAGLYDRP